MPDEDKTFSGSFVLDFTIWWRQAHTLYKNKPELRNDRNGTATIFINQPPEMFESVASRTDKPAQEPNF